MENEIDIIEAVLRKLKTMVIENGWYKDDNDYESHLYYYEHNVIIIKHTYNKKMHKYNEWRIIDNKKKLFDDQSVLSCIWGTNWDKAKMITGGGNITTVISNSQVGNGNVMVNNMSVYKDSQVGNYNFGFFN